MKRIFFFLIAVYMIQFVGAQGFSKAEYFFDTDPGINNGTQIALTGTSDTINFSAVISTASLTTGFHFLGLRVKHNDGTWSLFEKRGFYISASANDAADILSAEYFFDADPGMGNGTPTSVGTSGSIVNFTAVIPTSLSAGFHFISIRTKGTDGVWGLYDKRGFYVTPSTSDAANILAAEYFFDTDPGVGNATPTSVGSSGSIVNFTAVIPTSLSAGFHFLSIRVKGADGIWGLYDKRGFYISSAAVDAANIVNAEYFFDTDPGVGNGTPASVGASGSVVNFTTVIPTSLSSGFHFLSIRTKGTDGVWGLFEKRGFYISTATANMPIITNAEYFYDSDPGVGNGQPLTITTPGDTVTQTFNVPVPGAMPNGQHFLSIRVKDQAGNWGLFDYDTLTIGVSTISCPSNATANTGAGQCTAVVNNLDPTISPAQSYTYTLTGATTGSGSGSVSGFTFNAGVTSVTYTLASSPNCSFNVTVTALPPTITTQPSPQSVCAGSNVTFTVAATGTGLGYQWRKNGTNIPGATSASYTINGVAASDAGNYDVVVTSGCNVSATSNTATLAVGVGASITSQPSGQTVCPGSNVTFTVAATGSGLTYQWRKNTANISGATGTSYTINGVTSTDAGNYDVVITGSCGTITSNIAALTVNTTTVINTQPSSQSICTGSNVTFTVNASGTTLTYQWRKNTTNIPGATSASYTITGAAAGDAGNYDVIVSGACGTLTSNTAVLTVGVGASITSQPASQAACPGNNVTFTVTATGSGLGYQWRKNTTNIPGAISASYTINGIGAGDAGNYDVVITGSCGTITSNTAVLTVNTATVINTQPSSQSVCTGNNATFTVSAGGTALTYQWRKNSSNISGATAASYTITGAAGTDAGNYDVIVSGTCGTLTSSVATLTVNPLTAITGQPASQTICAGTNVTFIVTATGASLTYQWRKNTINISGATSSSYTITNAAASDAASYDVIVSGTCGAVTSIAATLVVNAVTAINTQPASQTVCTGNNISFSVAATGTSLIYQWRKNGTNIPGATATSFSIINATTADAGNYDVVVSGTCGTVTSTVATLTVNALTAITTQPASQTVCTGNNVTFNVTATGASLTYQWRKNSTNISGATSSSYTITNVALGDAGSYDVVVGGACGTATSTAAILSINAATSINGQPSSQTVCTGNNVTFSVTASGTSIGYQWRKNGSNISGATSSSYTITNVVLGDAGNYDVVVSGTCGNVTSAVAILTVNTNASITSQPASQTVCSASNVSFTITATGSSLTYQWRKNGANIPGATASTYTITNVAAADAGNYDVIVTSSSCVPSVTSSVAVLTVNPTPTFTLGNIPSSLCRSDSAITLTASVTTGVWSGAGVSGNKFDPSVVGVGSFNIVYTVTNSSGCSSTASTTITVNECPERHRTLDRKDAITVYPNPNYGQFKIRVNSDLYSKFSMKVYGADGRFVYEKEYPGLFYGIIIPVDLRKLQDGVYMLYIYGNSSNGLAHRTVQIVIGR